MSSRAEAVKVCLRVRPLFGAEKLAGQSLQMTPDAPDEVRVATNIADSASLEAGKRFTFDYVLGPEHGQSAMHEQCVQPLLEGFLEGYNATILAYGQTGSGKTYTMGTASSHKVSEQDLGIVPRVVRQMFAHLSTKAEQGKSGGYNVKVSFLEVHNEKVHDLLCVPGTAGSAAVPSIRENTDGAIVVSGVREREVEDEHDMLRALEQGTAARHTGSTHMNAVSSRSHAVFTVMLTQTRASGGNNDNNDNDEGDGDSQTNGESADDEIITSKFHFVDLAGSERLKRTGAEGARMREGININCGLLALANVISALTDEKRRAGGHVPFRASKITRLLQDSLGGNSRTLMIACASSAGSNYEETLSTLRYASRARKIENRAVVNRDPNLAKMARMRSRIRELEAAVALQGGSIPLDEAQTTSVSQEEWGLLQDQARLYEEEMVRLQGRLADSRSAMSELQSRFLKASEERDVLKARLNRSGGNNNNSVYEDGDTGLVEQGSADREALLKAEALLRERSAEVRVLRAKLKASTTAAAGSGAAGDKPEEDAHGNEDVQWGSAVDFLQEDFGSMEDDEQSPEQQESDGDSDIDLAHSEEAQGLKAVADLKNREHALRMKQLGKAQSNLSRDISAKERQLKVLMAAKAQRVPLHEQEKQEQEGMMKEARRRKRMAEMNNQLQAAQSERDSVLALVRAEQAKGQQNSSLLSRYQQQLKELKARVATLKGKQLENERLRAQHGRDETQIYRLKYDITQAKKQKVKLVKSMKERGDEYRTWLKEKDRKLKMLAKEARQNTIVMDRLQARLDKQDAVLKRAHEEKAALHGKLRRKEARKVRAKQARERSAAASKKRAQDRRPFRPQAVAGDSASDNGAGATSREGGLRGRSSRPALAALPTSGSTQQQRQQQQQQQQQHQRQQQDSDKGAATSFAVWNSSTTVVSHTKPSSKLNLKLDSEISHVQDKENMPPPASSSSKASPVSNASSLQPAKLKRQRDQISSKSVEDVTSHILSTLNSGDLKSILGLAGIGKKRAELVMAERENNKIANRSKLASGQRCQEPFMGLQDLKKIGFSTKQANDMFQKNLMQSILNRQKSLPVLAFDEEKAKASSKAGTAIVAGVAAPVARSKQPASFSLDLRSEEQKQQQQKQQRPSAGAYKPRGGSKKRKSGGKTASGSSEVAKKRKPAAPGSSVAHGSKKGSRKGIKARLLQHRRGTATAAGKENARPPISGNTRKLGPRPGSHTSKTQDGKWNKRGRNGSSGAAADDSGSDWEPAQDDMDMDDDEVGGQDIEQTSLFQRLAAKRAKQAAVASRARERLAVRASGAVRSMR